MNKDKPNGTEKTQKNIQCSNCSDNEPAISYCIECRELICASCVDAHQRLKSIRNHTIKTIQETAVLDVKCKSCTDDALAVSWCVECSEFICGNCATAHQRIKMTNSHTIISKANLSLDDRISSKLSKTSTDSCTIPDQILPELRSVQTRRVTECSHVSDSTETVETDNGIQSDQISFEVQAGCSHQSDNNNSEPDQEHTSDRPTNPQTKATNTRQNVSLSNWFNLTTILKNSSKGKEILDFYEEEGLILPKHRKLINKLILEKTFSVKNELTVAEREEIAQQISVVFHKEQSNKYFNKEKGPKGQILTGSLQAAYSYRKAKLGNIQKRKRIVAQDMEDVEDESQSPSNYFDVAVEKSFRNIQQNSINDDMAIIDWDKCFQFRKAKMSHYGTINEVCKDWRFFCRLDGFFFIEHDFGKMFGSGSVLLYNWCDFVESNLRIIMAMMHDPRVANSLKELNVGQGTNEKNIIFCMALFHIPEIIQPAIGYGGKRWRPTVKMSKNSVFKRVYSRDSIAKALRARNFERYKNEIKEHPIIYGVGEDLDEMTNFYVALGDMLFHFGSFIEALDASFKCYKVFQLAYPMESVNFWKFINLIFYKAGNEQNSASIMNVLNSLKLDYSLGQ